MKKFCFSSDNQSKPTCQYFFVYWYLLQHQTCYVISVETSPAKGLDSQVIDLQVYLKGGSSLSQGHTDIRYQLCDELLGKVEK